MYNSNFISTYAYYDAELSAHCKPLSDPEILEKNDDSETSNEISNCIFQSDFLQAFNLTDFEEDLINKETKRLYKIFVENGEFKACMKKVANKYVSEDLYIGFMLLFSYEYFFLTHSCICEYLNTKEIPTLEKLKNYLK